MSGIKLLLILVIAVLIVVLFKYVQIKRQIRNLSKQMTDLTTGKALIQTFYDVSVIDAKEVTPVREDFNLTNLLINLITENAPALEAKGISPVIGLPNHSVYLHSDYGMVERIFQNLIINAIRYSSGSIKIDLKQGKEKSAIFIIENPIDSKVEIDPNRLFERFYTGDKSRHNSGTGVGLAVVKQLTDKLGGNVFAKIENDTLTISLEIK